MFFKTAAAPILLEIIAATAAVLLLLWLIYKLIRQIRFHLRLPKVVPDTIFPDSKFIEVQGFKIRYIQRGRKNLTPLVLIHGIGASIYSWRLIIDQLAQSYYVTAFDLPGFGLSDKNPQEEYDLDRQTARIMQLLDSLQIKKFYLVGHSMGGAIAAWIAKINPARVEKAALIAPAIGYKLLLINPQHWWWGLKWIQKFIVTPTLIKRIYIQVRANHHKDELDEIVGHYYRPYHRQPEAVETFFKHLALVRDERLVRQITSLECPVLVIYGEKDPVIRKRLIKKFLKRNPEIVSVSAPDCGHLIAEENPALIIRELRNFFDKLS